MIAATGTDRAASERATVRVAGVSVFYGEVLGLSRVDLELEPGVTGIVGPNGSGKSTLMKALCGLLPPDEGSLNVLGGEPFRQAAVRQGIGFVPALECFHQELTGRRNLIAAFLSHGHGGRTSRAAGGGRLGARAGHGARHPGRPRRLRRRGPPADRKATDGVGEGTRGPRAGSDSFRVLP